MFIEMNSELDNKLREIAETYCSDVAQRGHFYSAMKSFKHQLAKDLMNDFRITLENKEQEILNQFPIE
jgi:hypothetical protein